MIVSLAYSAIAIAVGIVLAYFLGAIGLGVGTLVGAGLCCYFDPKGLAR